MSLAGNIKAVKRKSLLDFKCLDYDNCGTWGSFAAPQLLSFPASHLLSSIVSRIDKPKEK
ncbi:MAG: hypothetical protein D4R88_07945 [Methanosarcinales archaeon]|nr:MAG: hypothetical protein D4R88_07945 [Methanosarcinales archaeon]